MFKKLINLTLLLLVVCITCTARADEIMRPEIEISVMVVKISSEELQKAGLENEIGNLSEEEIQTLQNKLQRGEIKGKVTALPLLRTADGTEATTKLSFMRTETIFTATPEIDGNIVKVLIELQLIDAVKTVKTSAIIQIKNGETALINGIGNSKAEKEDLDIMVFVTANIMNSQIEK